MNFIKMINDKLFNPELFYTITSASNDSTKFFVQSLPFVVMIGFVVLLSYLFITK